MEAIILAGGLGTRLRTVVPNLPKPMAPINGKPFLAYLLNYWQQQGVTHFILGVGYKHAEISDYFADQYEGVPITYSIEQTPIGTGGGLLKALSSLKTTKPFLIVNGDTFFSIPLLDFKQYHYNQKADLTVALYQVKNNMRYAGVQLNKNNHISEFNTKKISKENVAINGGVYLANPSLFKNRSYTMPLSLETTLIPDLLSEKKCLAGKMYNSVFIDIGVPNDYHRSQNILTRNEEQ